MIGAGFETESFIFLAEGEYKPFSLRLYIQQGA